VSEYGERDAQRVVLLRSDNAGQSWVPDVAGGGGPALAANQQRFDISPSVIYAGTAARGVDETDAVWTVKKIELSSGDPTSIMWATEIAWNDRTTEEYS
jgi:hypothetical protein